MSAITTYQEIIRLVAQLPLDQQLMVLEELTRILRMALLERQKRKTHIRRGVLKSPNLTLSDADVKESYTDYLIEKYFVDQPS